MLESPSLPLLDASPEDAPPPPRFATAPQRDRTQGRGRALAIGAVVLLLVCFASDQLRALLAYGRLATDEDQTLLWYAGRELVHLHLHEPNFYGQNYNTVFEALPGELFHLAGVSLALAGPLASMLMASTCWLVLAWAAHRRGSQLAVLAALALPVCLSVPYLLLFDAPRGVLSGDLTGVVAIAAALVIQRPRLRLAVLIGLGGLAVLWENAIALAVIPALVAVVAGDWRALLDRPRRGLAVVVGALAAPGAWRLLDRLWYASHPADITAQTVNTKLQLSVLGTNLSHPGRLFSFYEPQLLPHPWAILLAIAGLLTVAVAIGVRRHRPEPVAAAFALLALLLLALSVSDTLDLHRDLYLAGSRFLLPLPIALWVVLYFSAAATPRREGLHGRAIGARRLLCAGVVVVATVSWFSTQARFSAQVRAVSAADTAAHPVLPILNPNGLLAECAALNRIYGHEHAQLLVTFQRDVAYGCAAQSGLNTLDTDYDRRAWLVQAAAARPLERILVQGWPCRAISRPAGECRPVGQGTVLLSTPKRAPTVSLALGGVRIRGVRGRT